MPAGQRWSVVVAALVAATVEAQWAAQTGRSWRQGMSNVDTLLYHGTFTGRFVQTGRVTPLVFTHDEPLHTFNPANSELLHAVVALPYHRDVLSPALNLGFVGLALLAAWCIGRPWGVGAHTLVAVAIVVASPIFAWTQAGEPSNDIVGVALVLSAVALLVTDDSIAAGQTAAALAVAGAAAGLALGTKLSFVAGVVALTVAVVFLRRRASRWWLAALASTGSFWYLRNLVATGSPLPYVGTITVPELRAQGFSVAHYLADGRFWRDVVPTGLRTFFGNGWIPILALAAAGLGAALVPGRQRTQIVIAAALTGAVSALAYVLTPFSAGGPEGAPTLFVWDLRFLALSVAIGLVLVPIIVPTRVRGPLLAILLALLVVTELDARRLTVYRAHLGSTPVAWVGIVVILILGAARLAPRSMGAITLVAAVAFFPVQRSYLAHRYRLGGWSVGGAPLDAVFAWAQGVHHDRIALGGYFRTPYPIFGTDLSNRVRYVGHPGSQGGYSRIRRCDEWLGRLAAGRYHYAIVGDWPGEPSSAEKAWLLHSPGTVEQLGGPVALFRLDRAPDPATCAGQ